MVGFRKIQAAGLLLLSVAVAPVSAETLRDIYELALNNDAQLKAQAAQYRADLELENLALAPLLPQASAGVSTGNSDADTVQSRTLYSENLGGLISLDSNSRSNTDTDSWDVSLSQKLFDLSAWYSWKAGEESANQAEATFAAATQNLIVRVAEAYFSVLRAQDNLQAAEARERALSRQLEQTRQRFEVGLIAITDVYEAEAARDLAEVTRIVEENNVAVAQERLSVLTGSRHGALFRLSEDFATQQPSPVDRDAWVDFALENNWSLKAARFGEEAARQTATSKRMGHAPTVTASYRYNDTESAGVQTYQGDPLNYPNDSQSVQESWQLRLDMPLYSGGALSASRRRAAEQFNAARENRINLTRNTVTAARSLHMTVMSDAARVNARQQAIKSTQSALDATTAGYEVGTRNIVDVLNAQNAVFAARRDYANSRYDYIINMLRLKENAGLLSPNDIGQLDDHLVAPPPATASSR